MAAELAQKVPLVHITKNKKVRCRAKQEYYYNKIRCLIDMNLPVSLIMLACWDAPVEKDGLDSVWGRKRFIKKCLKYYQRQLKLLIKEENELS